MENLPTWINPFDFFIILTLIVGTAIGFVRGLVRMAINLLILYISMVLAMTFYNWLAKQLVFMSSGFMSVRVSQALAFVLILVLVNLIAGFVLRRTYKDTQLPGLRQVDQLGGMVVGFIVTCTWIGLALVALAFVLSANVGASGLQANLIYFFRHSLLVPIFYRFLPLVIATLRPWMPKGLSPEILELNLF